MISHYTAIVFMSVFAMLAMILGAESNMFMPIKVKRSFQTLFLLLIITNLSEWIGASLNGLQTSYRSIIMAVKFTEFILAPVVPIACVEAFGGNKNVRFMIISMGMNFILQVFSLFTGVVFYVNSENIYIRGPLYFMYITLFSCCLIFCIIQCSRVGKKYQSGNCYRFGGDEFCVIMTQNIGNVDKVILRFANEMEKICKKHKRLPSVSVG